MTQEDRQQRNLGKRYRGHISSVCRGINTPSSPAPQLHKQEGSRGGQKPTDSVLSFHCASRGLNSDRQTWQQVLLLAEPSCWPWDQLFCGDSKSVPHICVASAFPTEPSPQAHSAILKYTICAYSRCYTRISITRLQNNSILSDRVSMNTASLCLPLTAPACTHLHASWLQDFDSSASLKSSHKWAHRRCLLFCLLDLERQSQGPSCLACFRISFLPPFLFHVCVLRIRAKKKKKKLIHVRQAYSY